jgi:hypothetical protein
MRGSFIAIAVLLLATACGSSRQEAGSGGAGGAPSSGGSGGSGAAGAGGTGTSTADDLAATEADFECIKDWTQVRKFWITNKLGKLQAALDVANGNAGGTYPVGTIIQLIPTEAMIKRKAGFSAETNDWEFFSLTVAADGTTIDARGTKDVINQFGGNCFDCHSQAEPKWDMICESGHGCEVLPLSDKVIKNIQDGDPRCK